MNDIGHANRSEMVLSILTRTRLLMSQVASHPTLDRSSRRALCVQNMVSQCDGIVRKDGNNSRVTEFREANRQMDRVDTN